MRSVVVLVGSRGGIPFVKREGVSALGKFDTYGICRALASVVLGEFCAQAAGLDTDHGIDSGIEVWRAAKLFCSNLVFLDRGAGVLERVVSEITQELAQ